MTLTDCKVTEIFFLADDFCKEFYSEIKKYSMGNEPKRKPRMSHSEVITIMILFHYGCYRNMKHFYIEYVQKHMGHLFPQTVSYNRFVELMESETLALAIFVKTFCVGECTGISYVDSTPLRVCKDKRVNRHKVFKGIAKMGKSTMGWFYGFKLHLLLNEKGEILNL